MIDKAYRALDAIHRHDGAALAGLEPWVGALRTIRWAIETDEGVGLTPAGHRALAEMAHGKAAKRAA